MAMQFSEGDTVWTDKVTPRGDWNVLRFLVMGPESVTLLICARVREAAIRRHQRRQEHERLPLLRG